MTPRRAAAADDADQTEAPVVAATPLMRIDIISIFPGYFAALDQSLIGRAIADGLLDVRVHDLRDWTHDRHRTVDDTPYGGGAGMVMKPEPWGEALDALLASRRDDGRLRPSGQGTVRAQEDAASSVTVRREQADGSAPLPVLVVPTPAGIRFTQAMAEEFASASGLAFACGRYEGIDHRVIEWASDRFDVREVSLGDYVLNGGEVATLAMIEAVARLVPGVIGNPESLLEESHSQTVGGLLEAPVYTKPAAWRGLRVPEILLSGNHALIAAWRKEQSETLTRSRRPDLLDGH
ncbi:tRNA (guanosine(37)-N1)-methyltransferase TrmD [Brooklawnia cerclae]|uniref:tRNA (guanine-N(1)-)-methyltransferase n=2 Tax=Brooklawnia cerclae TaxID=349934 RepID=A0ABX0SG75_9ACTN|nr:tRNA (guanine37-N1)-methyltransferase [Brooklawnia cerclae]